MTVEQRRWATGTLFVNYGRATLLNLRAIPHGRVDVVVDRGRYSSEYTGKSAYGTKDGVVYDRSRRLSIDSRVVRLADAVIESDYGNVSNKGHVGNIGIAFVSRMGTLASPAPRIPGSNDNVATCQSGKVY